MNTNSVICNFIREHPEDWDVLLTKDYHIKVKKEGNLAIFNYSFDCDYSDPIVQEARGIIVNFETMDVVCWPFRKFGNYNESYADAIDWEHACVLEKVDGSIIKLWFDHDAQKWQFSTNGMIRAENARINTCQTITYDSIIRRADNFDRIPFDDLDKSCTYIFELVSPQTQVVLSYETASLYHIGTRNNLTGQELNTEIGIQKPKTYPIRSLAECIQAAIELNRNNPDAITAEGFVVVDQNWNRVKVKSPDYILRHKLMQMKTISKQDCLKMILEQSPDAAVICRANPELIPVFKFYDFQLAQKKLMADKIGTLSRMLSEEYNGDRSAIAKIIGTHPLAYIGFRCLTNEKSGSEILMENSFDRLLRLIPDYEEENLYDLFLKGGERN